MFVRPCHVILIAGAFVLLASAVAAPASAQFAVESPKVDKGKTEVETHGSFQSGLPEDDEGEGVRYGQELEVSHGITDFWKIGLGISVQKPEDGGFEASAIELQNTFQIGEVPQWNMTFGMLASVSLGVGGAEEPDAVEFGPAVQFGDEKTGSLILNGIFEKTFGEHREDGMGFEYAAQLRIPVNKMVGLGGEAFGEIEDIGNAGGFDESQLRIGPMLYLSFGDDDDDEKGSAKRSKGRDDDEDKSLKSGGKEQEIELGMGVLFGVTDATDDVTFKWDLEVSF